MARWLGLAVELAEGTVDATTGLPDTTAALALTTYPLRVEWAAPGPVPTVDAQRGETHRKSRGASKSATPAAYHTRSSVRYANASGSMEVELELCQPGAGVWTSQAIWHLLRSAYALDTPARTNDTIVGVSTTRHTPTNPGDWQTGDLAATTEGGAVYPFRVTGRAGNDLLVSPGTNGTTGTSARLAHRLYMRPGSEGSSLCIFDHQDSTLWIGAGSRLGNHSFRRGGDGRLLMRATILVGRWYSVHASTDPYQSMGAQPLGGPAIMLNSKLRVTNDYEGQGGGLTTAPQYAAALSGLNLEGFELTIERTFEIRNGIHNPTGFCGIDFGESTVTLRTDLCDYSASLNEDLYRGPGVRHLSFASSEVAAGTGVMFWSPAQINSIPDVLEPGEVRQKQALQWILSSASEPVDEAPGGPGAATHVNDDGFCLGLFQ